MKCSPLRLFLGIALMLIPMGLYAQEVIELTTQKKAGETIKLKVQAQGDYSIEGIKETASKEKTKQTIMAILYIKCSLFATKKGERI